MKQVCIREDFSADIGAIDAIIAAVCVWSQQLDNSLTNVFFEISILCFVIASENGTSEYFEELCYSALPTSNSACEPGYQGFLMIRASTSEGSIRSEEHTSELQS